MSRVALGELAFDKLRCGAAHDVGIKTPLQVSEKRLLAPQIARLEQPGADRQIGFGLTQAFLDRARRLTDLQAEVPQQIEQILDNLLGMRGPLVGQQKQQVDVGIGRQLTAPITTDGDDGQPLARGRIGERIDVAGNQVEHRTDQLVHQKGLLAHHRGAIAARLETPADLCMPLGQRGL